VEDSFYGELKEKYMGESLQIGEAPWFLVLTIGKDWNVLGDLFV